MFQIKQNSKTHRRKSRGGRGGHPPPKIGVRGTVIANAFLLFVAHVGLDVDTIEASAEMTLKVVYGYGSNNSRQIM